MPNEMPLPHELGFSLARIDAEEQRIAWLTTDAKPFESKTAANEVTAARNPKNCNTDDQDQNIGHVLRRADDS